MKKNFIEILEANPDQDLVSVEDAAKKIFKKNYVRVDYGDRGNEFCVVVSNSITTKQTNQLEKFSKRILGIDVDTPRDRDHFLINIIKK